MFARRGFIGMVVAVLGFVAVGQSNRLNSLEDAMRDQTIERQANDAVANSELNVRLSGTAGSGEAVVRSSGQGYLILDGVPAPADGDVYQLWGKVDQTILSLGTFGEASRTDDGRTVTRKIEQKKYLEGVKPGDKIDITMTRAIVTSVESAK